MPSPAIDGVPLYPIGLGCMPLSVAGGPDERQGVRTIHAALDAGVNLLDTADSYCHGEHDIGRNERLVARALRGRRDEAIVATKGGHTRPGGGWDVDGRPEHLRAACEASLRALDTDRIDLYQFHRPDPKVPFAESVGALRELQDAGKVRWVGLSNVTVAQLAEAERIVEVSAVQNELSLRYLAPLHNGELEACAERGIPFLAWSPLGGMAAARAEPGRLAAVRTVAEQRGASPQRVVLAWLLSLAEVCVPIPGASRPETIRDSAAAPGLRLTPGERDLIGAKARTPFGELR